MSTAPLQFLLMLFAGWVNRRQLDMIDYLKHVRSLSGRSAPSAFWHLTR